MYNELPVTVPHLAMDAFGQKVKPFEYHAVTKVTYLLNQI